MCQLCYNVDDMFAFMKPFRCYFVSSSVWLAWMKAEMYLKSLVNSISIVLQYVYIKAKIIT